MTATPRHLASGRSSIAQPVSRESIDLIDLPERWEATLTTGQLIHAIAIRACQ